MPTIKGYDYGKAGLARSPVSLQDLELLKKTVLWSEADEAWFKAVTLTALLWCHPYVHEGQF